MAGHASLGLVWPLGLLWVTIVAEAPGWAMFLSGLRAYLLGLVGGLPCLTVSALLAAPAWVELLSGAFASLFTFRPYRPSWLPFDATCCRS